MQQRDRVTPSFFGKSSYSYSALFFNKINTAGKIIATEKLKLKECSMDLPSRKKNKDILNKETEALRE